MAAPTPAIGTRGQSPGVGSHSQPRRRNPVNAPRTWRGTKQLASNNTQVALSAGVGLAGSTAVATLTVAQSALLGQQVPGVGRGQPRRRNPVNAPRTWRGTRVPLTINDNVGLQGRGVAGSRGSATFNTQPTLGGVSESGSRGTASITIGHVALAGVGIPGVGSNGHPRRRNPVNAPRTWRGTRVLGLGPPGSPVISLAARGQGGSQASAVFFVLTNSFVGVAETGSVGRATLSTRQNLNGSGSAGSVGVSTLRLAEKLVGSGNTGSVGAGTLSAAAAFDAAGNTGTKLAGQLAVSVPLVGAGESGSSGELVTQSVLLQGSSSTGVVGSGVLALTIQLVGGGRSGSIGHGHISLGLAGAGRTGSIAAGELSYGGAGLGSVAGVDAAIWVVVASEL